MKKKDKNTGQGKSTIAVNKKARHEYHMLDSFESGLVLEGWEVKSLRQGNIQLTDSYVLLKNGEAWVIGVNITPLNTVSTHVVADPRRDRKLLLNKKELSKLFIETQQSGCTCICTKFFWKKHLIKAEICLAKGKKEYDKRSAAKEREWNIEKQRIVRHTLR